MCIYSTIMDEGKKQLEDYIKEYYPPQIPQKEKYPKERWHELDFPTIPKIEDTSVNELEEFNPSIDFKDKMSLEEWVKYFENLLKLAKEFDIKTGQPDCEDTIKKMTIQKIAKELGVEISFPD